MRFISPIAAIALAIPASLIAQAPKPAAQTMQPATQPTLQPASEPSASPAPAVDPTLHANTLKLLEVMDFRAKLIAGQTKVLPDAKKKMVEAAPGITQEFLDEWAKRMMADENINQYVAVVSAVYEKHFTNDQMLELIQLQKDVNANKPPVLSESLKAKFNSDSIALQSEIMGACTQLGARQGGEIGEQIAKEHPEWIKTPPPMPDSKP